MHSSHFTYTSNLEPNEDHMQYFVEYNITADWINIYELSLSTRLKQC